MKAVVRLIAGGGLMDQGRWSGEGFVEGDHRAWSGGSKGMVRGVTGCGKMDQGR